MDRERRFKKYILVAIAATIEYIEKNPLDCKTTSQFAIDANINRKQLQAGFKEIMGMGLQQYLQIRRMQMAALLLKEGKIPMKEIALTCRFKSQRAFTTAFKKRHGMTPTEYQNNYFEDAITPFKIKLPIFVWMATAWSQLLSEDFLLTALFGTA